MWLGDTGGEYSVISTYKILSEEGGDWGEAGDDNGVFRRLGKLKVPSKVAHFS